MMAMLAGGCGRHTIAPQGAKEIPARASQPLPAPTATAATTQKAVAPAAQRPHTPVRQPAAVSVLEHGDRSEKWVALTIDDGPHPEYTPRLLKILKQAGVHVTFFVVGMLAEQHPDLIRAEVADGHEVATHTYSHPDLRKLQPDQVKQEMLRGGAAVKRVTGVTPNILRPPYGFYDPYDVRCANALGYTIVLWSLHSGDSQGLKPEKIYERIRKAQNGDIILMHDGFGYTPRALPTVLQILKNRGFRLVTIEEMLQREVQRRTQRATTKAASANPPG
jgi:peptidoglycan/xylan/chitin deacetylase (PgdA/CDA1 family)